MRRMTFSDTDSTLVLKQGVDTAVAEAFLAFTKKHPDPAAQFLVLVLSSHRLYLIEVTASGHAELVKKGGQ